MLRELRSESYVQTTVEVVALEVARPSSSTAVVVVPSSISYES